MLTRTVNGVIHDNESQWLYGKCSHSYMINALFFMEILGVSVLAIECRHLKEIVRLTIGFLQ